MTHPIESAELRVPHDALGFVCRECPSCHRAFKTRLDERDHWVVLCWLSRVVPHANLQDVPADAHPRHCPYCGATGTHEAWLTEAQQEYLEACAQSVRGEIRQVQLVHGLRSLRDNPRRTFVPVTAERPTPTPPREGADLRLLRRPCCGGEVLVSSRWTESIHCPGCGRKGQAAPPGQPTPWTVQL